MNRDELKEIIGKYGYKLEKLYRFKKHDRLRIITPPDPTLKSSLVLTLTLHKHLEETDGNGLLAAILTKADLKERGER